MNGETAGQNGADGKYVEPKSHIIVTTQTLFERWLRAHKDWWGKKSKNVPQQIAAAPRTSALTPGDIERRRGGEFEFAADRETAATSFVHAMRAGRTQSELPDAADHVFVSATANGKVYIAYGLIDPPVQVPDCLAIRGDYIKKAEQAADDLQSGKIARKAYDKLGDIRQKGDDAYKRCFTQHAPNRPYFADAARQAERLSSAALNTR